jgi:hypothetical protein
MVGFGLPAQGRLVNRRSIRLGDNDVSGQGSRGARSELI